MTALVSCPHCGRSVDPQIRQCPHCGIDLALAAVMAERLLTFPKPVVPGGPIAPEILVPRLGEYLIEKGVLNPDDLQRALQEHSRLNASGQPRLMGQLLLEMGLVDRETLDQAITEQILKLQDVLQQANRQLERRVQERTSELQQAVSKLAELNQLKTNFISNISHELRTPLTHIRGYLSLLSDGSLGPLTGEQRQAFDVLLRAEARLEQLIDDLIQFSLATRGELSLNIGPTSISDLINISVMRSSRLAKARKVTLQSSFPDNLPYIRCDGEKITWVILQLLDNAIKFTPQGGKVTISAQLENSLITVRVMDTGIGISPERLEEIFEPFHQLDGSETRKYGGVGLGLALVKRIIEAHGASIRVSSTINQGSRFEFSLPVIT